MQTEPDTDGTCLQAEHCGVVSIEKAILLDVCLGLPLGKIWFKIPAARAGQPLPPGPGTCLFRGEQLALMKSLYREGDPAIGQSVKALCQQADKAMALGPFSVTHKTELPPSGDMHDYYSIAKYWWPDPNSNDGLPYVKRDGDVNPACYGRQYDFTELEQFAESVVVLALTAFLTDKAAYGKRAALLLQTWFVDEATRQNASFPMAQRIPGKDEARAIGIIEARRFAYVAEAVHLLEGAKLLPPVVGDPVRAWFREFLRWMTESDIGKQAGKLRNNIGFWFDLQRLVYADLCGDGESVRAIATQVTVPRLDEQLAMDGSLPAETLRAYPHDYVAFTVAAMAMISGVGAKHGLELWEARQGDGRSFRVAQDWLLKLAHSHELVDPVSIRSPSSVLHAVEGGASGSDLLSQGALVDLGLQLRGAWRISRERAAEIRTLQEQHEAARQEAANAQLTHASAKEELLAKIARLEEELRGRADREKELEKPLAAMETERKAASARLADVPAISEGVEGDLVQGIDELLAELATRKSKLDQLEEVRANEQAEWQAREQHLKAQVDTGNAMWEHFQERFAAAENELKEARKQVASLRREQKAARNGSQRGNHDKTIQKLQEEHEAERRFLQAQLDTANAMWAFYQNGGKAPAEGDDSHPRPSTGHKSSPAKAGGHEEKSQRLDSATLKQKRRDLKRELRELTRYSRRLESKFQQLLNARTWRALGPVRALLRGGRRTLLRQPTYRNRWPKRPLVLEQWDTKRKGSDSGADTPSNLRQEVRTQEQQARELSRYARSLETKVQNILRAQTWKAMAPVRAGARAYRRYVLGQKTSRTRLPKRPSAMRDK